MPCVSGIKWLYTFKVTVESLCPIYDGTSPYEVAVCSDPDYTEKLMRLIEREDEPQEIITVEASVNLTGSCRSFSS